MTWLFDFFRLFGRRRAPVMAGLAHAERLLYGKSLTLNPSERPVK